ncbi:PAAR domain-containing protein [Paraburkholderia sp. Ac-20347]|uniref:PAAR domain-containing protein n=1 Tax=Paraburkholderia sp. Ac-20347 TaxID=2703892 RepID=UPI00197E334E|nr:PAAR domain-containing protein [Paraburkholderia sp. Ac-20347]MBN3812484.1 PAAR domain-containing protein [Paraburkholderia sp. Ac-20347]
MPTRLALKDDRITTGGSILGPGSDWFNEGGRAFALAEDKATCGNCKGMWPVGGTAHNVMDEGQSFVKDLAPVYCPCGKNRVLASGDSPFFYSENLESDSQTAAAAIQPPHDEQFTLRDASGAPMGGTYYTVRLSTGEIEHGTTDEQGPTARYATERATSIHLYPGYREEI